MDSRQPTLRQLAAELRASRAEQAGLRRELARLGRDVRRLGRRLEQPAALSAKEQRRLIVEVDALRGEVQGLEDALGIAPEPVRTIRL
jgi:prefoldin subunit 5